MIATHFCPPARLLAARAWHERTLAHQQAFRHLERAHILGQASTIQHVRAHWHMFMWGLRSKASRETFGQLIRMVGAALKTAIGRVPSGNTGGSDVSPFKSMPVPQELDAIASVIGLGR